MVDKAHPRWNWWRCNTCGAFLVTVDVDSGTTPELLDCRGNGTPLPGGCKGRMTSAGYIDPAKWPGIVPREAMAVWYRPGAYDRSTIKRKFPALAKHMAAGGLVLRHVYPQEQFTFPKADAA